MLSKRPDRKPNLTLTNLRVEEGFNNRIYYDFAEARNSAKSEFWQIPINSTFDPKIEILPNTAYAIWSTIIYEPYITTTGRHRNRARHEWEWIEPLEQYLFDTQTETTKHAKERLMVDAYHRMVEAQNNFIGLFETIVSSARKKIK